jgi:hypothetical protein
MMTSQGTDNHIAIYLNEVPVDRLQVLPYDYGKPCTR